MYQYIALIGISLVMSSCGKKGPVEPLEPSDYPRPYPKSQPSESFIVNKPKKVENP